MQAGLQLSQALWQVAETADGYHLVHPVGGISLARHGPKGYCGKVVPALWRGPSAAAAGHPNPAVVTQ